MRAVGVIVLLWSLLLACASEDLFLTMSNNVDDKVQTEHILITDVSQRNEDSLICWHRSRQTPNGFHWYHKFIEHSPSDGRSEIPKITQTPPYYFGWSSKVEINHSYHKLKLLREPDSVAVEGVFTCDTGDGDSTSVGIHYPILSVVGSIQVSGDGGTFKVSCTSTGGRPLTMSVTGPSGVVENKMNIVVEGDMEGMGNDTFSGNVIRQRGSPGDVFICKASNGISNTLHSFTLRVASSPTLLVVALTSATSVIVEWSQPSGGATVTGYVVHYSDGVTNMTESVPASSTSSHITNLTHCHKYQFSVETISEHFSGLSQTVLPTLGASLLVNLTAETISSTAITVQWDILIDCSHASYLSVAFTIKYTAEVGDVVQTIIVTKTEALLLGLIPYTNYSIEVAVVNVMGDVGPYSYPVTIQTPEDVPGKVSTIMVSPSQSQVSLSWDPPLMPNGIIIAYEVSYRPTASSEPETRVNTTALVTHFTTEDNIEEDTEFFFSVRAYTRVGPGNISSFKIKTALKSCSNIIYIILMSSIATVSCMGMSICGVFIIWNKAKRSSCVEQSRVDTQDNPAYSVTSGLQFSSPRMSNLSHAKKQEPTYDTIF